MELALNLALTAAAGAAGGAGPPVPFINLEGDDLSQITFGVSPYIESWGSFDQLTLGDQPTHNGTMNGKTVPYFSNRQFLEKAQIPVTDMTFVFAINKYFAPIPQTLMAMVNTSGPSNVWYISVASNGQVLVYGGSGIAQSLIGAISVNTPTILSIVGEIGENIRIYVNGVLSSLVTSVWNPSTGADKLRLGAEGPDSPDPHWIGLIARSQLFNTALSDSDRQYYESSATTKWIP